MVVCQDVVNGTGRKAYASGQTKLLRSVKANPAHCKRHYQDESNHEETHGVQIGEQNLLQSHLGTTYEPFVKTLHLPVQKDTRKGHDSSTFWAGSSWTPISSLQDLVRLLPLPFPRGSSSYQVAADKDAWKTEAFALSRLSGSERLGGSLLLLPP